MKGSRVAAAAVTMLFTFGGIVATGIAPAGAAVTGHVHCTGGGKVKAYANGAEGHHRVTLAAKIRLGCIGTTGNPNVPVTGTKVNLQFDNVGACSISGTNNSPWRLSVAWKTKHAKIDGSNITFSNSQASSSGWRLPSTSPQGASTTSGSYAGTTNAVGHVSLSPDALAQSCGDGGRGSKIVTVMGLDLSF